MLLIVGIIVVTVVLIGGSYAFLSLSIKGEKEVEITSGTLAIKFKDKNIINLENAYPISDKKAMETTPYEFTVENTGNINADYDVILEIEQGRNALDVKYIKYALKLEEENWSSPKLLSNLSSLIIDSRKIGQAEKNKYQIRLWIDEKAGNEAQGKEFKAKIVINASQEKVKKEDKVSPIIILAGPLSINIKQNEAFEDPGVESIKDDQDTLDKNNIQKSYEYYDGEKTVPVDGIDTSQVGVYYITYKIRDNSKNEGVVIRSINIYKEKEPPSITLKGNATEEIIESTNYQDVGATAIIEGEDRSDRIVTIGKVNSEKPGTYTIKYLITDNKGNIVSVARSVIVKEKNKLILKEINITEGNHDWYQNVGIEVKVTGTQTLANIYYCTTTEDKCEATTKATLSDNKTFDYTLQGNKNSQKVCFKAEDTLGNITTKCSDKYQVDNIIPTVNTVTATPDDDTLTIEIEGADRESGLYKYYYSKDGGINYISSYNANYTFSNLEAKDYLIVVYVEDRAGNISQTSVTSTTVRHKSYCEKNGINNLGDCVIATEAENVNIAEAKAEIDTKTKPDFTKVSPDITYKEVHDASTLTHIRTDYSNIGTNYTFNKKTGQYSVTGYNYIDPSTLDYTSQNYYTCIGMGTTCATMNKVERVTVNTNSSGQTTYNITVYPYRQTVEKYDNNEIGLYSINDDDGKSYYYRGAVGGNYVKFAGSYWRIIRVNGDGSVRMLYDGKKGYANGAANSERQVGTSAFNTYWNDNTYVGYMYGDHTKFQVTDSGNKIYGQAGLAATTQYYFGTSYTFNEATRSFKIDGTITAKVPSNQVVGLYTCLATSPTTGCQKMMKVVRFNSTSNLGMQVIEYSSTSLENAHSNINNSTLKTSMDNWYKNNLLEYTSKLSPATTFCNDRTISTYGNNTYQNQGYGLNPTVYNYSRFFEWEGSTIGNPRLTCENMRDRFSVTTTKGNGKLAYPVGLITIDEVNLAGGKAGFINTLYYLYNGSRYWTMSPYLYDYSYVATVFEVHSTGNISYYDTATELGIRPVINLDPSKITFTGSGTMNDPYVVT